MTDARRKSTMQPPSDPHGSIRSGIPLPTTAKKPTANMRMSLAGPAIRGPPLLSLSNAGPGTNPRQSMARSQNLNSLLQSASKPNYGRTPLHSSTRRTSVWAGGSSAPLPTSQSVKDPRPLRDRPFQNRMRQEIFSFLQTTGYDISMATLTNITGKDYRAIFDNLVLWLDPTHPLGQSARFEDEFVPALKALRYPYAHQIDNKWLAAPASMHSWPSLLGALHWLVEMCKLRSDYLTSGHSTLQYSTEVPEEFDDPNDHRALAFDYYEQAYLVWLDGADEFVEPNQALEERYTKRSEKVQIDLEEQVNRLNKARIELKNIQSSSAPIARLQDENGLLTADGAKFQKILDKYEGRKSKLLEAIAKENAELGKGGAQLEQLQTELSKLDEIVKTQNLSPEEVVRMNTDHETLSRNLDDLRKRISETHRIVMTLEVNVTNRSSAAEEALDTYTNLLSTLGLFPPLPPPWQDVDLTLELNTAASNPQELLLGADIKKIIKPTLSSVAESKRSERSTIESERIKLDNELDKLAAECENVDEEIGIDEMKVVALNKQADDLRDAAQQEALVSSGEAARLERELGLARTAALANGMGVKSRLQAIQFNYREQIDKVDRLREETVRAIVKNSNDIGMFKEEVSRHLGELRDFADSD